MNEKTIARKQPALHFLTEMLSDAGILNRINQDACCVRIMRIDSHTLVLAAVCDGVGGMEDGDYASKSTIQFLNNWFDYTVSREVCGKSQEEILLYLQEEMERCIQKQNGLIFDYAKERGIRAGTTLTLLVIVNREYITAQVGDSRAYCVNNGLHQLTEDQSLIAQEIKAGRLSPKDAKHDRRRNIILQCVGASKRLQIVYQRGTVMENDVFFLCSDGFIHELEDEEIGEFFRPESLTDRTSIKKRLKKAVALVKERGEKDNITVILIRVREDVQEGGAEHPRR